MQKVGSSNLSSSTKLKDKHMPFLIIILFVIIAFIYIVIIPPKGGPIIHKEFNANCDNGYTTGWTNRSYMEENVLYSRIDGIHTHYVVPEGITCTIVEKRELKNEK